MTACSGLEAAGMAYGSTGQMAGAGSARTAVGRPWHAGSWGVCALLALAGCAGETGTPPIVVRDSAGVRITESSEPVWRSGQAWRVVEPPLLEIGTAEGDEGQQLFEVRMAQRLADGSIVVLNEGTVELRWFDAAGRAVRMAGGRGDGPGEYRTLEFMAALPGDSVLAYSRVPAHVTLYGPDGRFVRRTALPVPERTPWFRDFDVAGLLEPGRLVVWSEPDYLGGVAFEDGSNRTPLPFAIADLDRATFDSVGVTPGFEVYLERTERGIRMTQVPFARRFDLVARGASIYLAPGEQHVVQVFDAAGRLVRIMRLLREGTPVTPDLVRAWLDERLARYPDLAQAARAEWERTLAAIDVPDTVPASTGIDVDRAGHVWVHAYRAPGTDAPPMARVFDPDGRWLGEVVLPAGLKTNAVGAPFPLDIGTDWLLGVWTDALDVEYVRLYRLEKPAG